MVNNISLEISFNTNIIIWLLRIIFPSNKSLTIVWDPTEEVYNIHLFIYDTKFIINY